MQPDKPFYKKPEWYLEKCTPAAIVTIAAVLTTFVNGIFNWAWLVAIGLYIVAVAAAIITSVLVTQHYNRKHGNPMGCQEAINAQCIKIDELQGKYSQRCEATIASMNTRIQEQQQHFIGVDKLVENAKRLERMFVESVAKRLRTNKQISEIEAAATPGSEIYIMTSSFLFERYDPDLRNAIVSNINRGVKYRYIIPVEKESEFKQMVAAILADKELHQHFRTEANDFLTAAKIDNEFFMLTIAYYTLPDDRCSAVIVKLPADTLAEVAEKEALAYLVPEGQKKSRGKAPSYNEEHVIFIENLTAIYLKGARDNGGLLTFTGAQLHMDYPSGVEICSNPKTYATIDMT
jgi:hypothetical protein